MASIVEIGDKQGAAALKAQVRKRFESVFPLLVEEITAYLKSIHLPEAAIEWYKKVLFPPSSS
jgi:farnesyl diphosphate synthase